MTYWMLVGTPENWEIISKNGFNLCAMKARRKNYATQVKLGDKVVFYLTKVQSFAGIAEFTSTVIENHSKLFVSEKKGRRPGVASLRVRDNSASATGPEGEDYPWRFKIKPEVVLPKEKAVLAQNLKDKLEYVKKWPPAHWKLAFQGNVHIIPKEDYETVRQVLEKAR